MTFVTLNDLTKLMHRPPDATEWNSDTADWRETEVSDAVENPRQTGTLTGIPTEDFSHISAKAN